MTSYSMVCNSSTFVYPCSKENSTLQMGNTDCCPVDSSSMVLVEKPRKLPHSTISMIFTSLPVGFIIAGIVFGNTLVICAVLRDKRLKGQTQNWLIVSLAVSDLLVGLLIMPLTLADELWDEWLLGEVMCEIWLASDVLFVTASILNLCAISLDRYWSLTDPVYCAARRTKRRIFIMIAFVWSMSFFICCPLLIGWRPESRHGECSLSNDVGYVLYSACGSFFIPVVTLLVVYARIFKITRNRARRQLRYQEKKREMMQRFAEYEWPAAIRPSTNNRTIDSRLCSHSEEPELQSKTDTTSFIESRPSVDMGVLKETNDSLEENAHEINGTSSSEKVPTQETLMPENMDRRVSTTGSYLSHSISSMSLLKTSELRQQISHKRKVTRRRERQATYLLGLILCAFIICWLPFFCAYVLRAICCQSPELLFDIIFWLGYCNSALNPFIYNYFNPDFRQAFAKILFPKRQQFATM